MFVPEEEYFIKIVEWIEVIDNTQEWAELFWNGKKSEERHYNVKLIGYIERKNKNYLFNLGLNEYTYLDYKNKEFFYSPLPYLFATEIE